MGGILFDGHIGGADRARRPAWRPRAGRWLIAGAAATLSACSTVPLGNGMSFKPIGKPSRNLDQAIAYCRYDEIKIHRLEPPPTEDVNPYKNLLAANRFMVACMRVQGYEVTWIGPPYRLP